MKRRKEIRPAHPGVYVDHTGPLTYEQREWVAVLAAWPAALSGEPAIPGRRPAVIEVAVQHGRKLDVPDGVRIRRTSQLTCFRRPGLPEAVLQALAHRSRLTGRSMIENLVTDLRDGACSVLERGYLHRVERAHSLPDGARQVVSEATGGRTVVDVLYDEFAVIVELQGRAIHDTAEAYDADAERDLAEAASGATETLRITYGQVFRSPCRTAARIAQVLGRRGWSGSLDPCPDCPRLA